MLSQKPVTQLGNRGLRVGRYFRRDRIVQMNQKPGNRRLLWSRRDRAGADLALPGFDNIGNAHTKTRRNQPGAPLHA